MIQEAYVSFETAKLLKEKGFDVYGDGSYGTQTEVHREYSPFGKIRDISASRPSQKGYPAPTQQMAMRWLREEKSLHIMVDCIGSKNYNPTIQCFDGNDYAVPGEVVSTIKNDEWVKYGFRSNEEAVEAAIKYCLTELL